MEKKIRRLVNHDSYWALPSCFPLDPKQIGLIHPNIMLPLEHLSPLKPCEQIQSAALLTSPYPKPGRESFSTAIAARQKIIIVLCEISKRHRACSCLGVSAFSSGTAVGVEMRRQEKVFNCNSVIQFLPSICLFRQSKFIKTSLWVPTVTRKWSGCLCA